LALLTLSLICVPLIRAQSAGAKLYDAKKCASCHGPDGSGNTPAGKALKARDFSSPDVQAQTDAQLSEVVATGKNKMPAYDKQLKPADIQTLVAYVRELGKKK
jgi:mono/diheme cytochrome c family protein